MKPENKIVLAFEKEDRVYRFELPNNAPLGEAHEAATAFFVKIVEIINEHAQTIKKEETVEEKESQEE